VDASLIAADANKHRSIPGGEWNKDIDLEQASRAVREHLATLDAPAYGTASEVTPKFISPSDPAAQWTGALRNAAFFAHADNYLIDVKFGVIIDVEASRAIRQAKVGASRTMIERTETCFGIKPAWLAADTAYGSAPNLDWLVNEKGIAPHVPVIDKSKCEDGTFSREDFTMTRSATSIPARRERHSPRPAMSAPTTASGTSRQSWSVVIALSNRNAVRTCRHVASCVM
jgi:hypothetical protein